MRFLRLMNQTRVGVYAGLFTLLMLGDGVMSYIIPVMIEEAVANQFQMGLILGFSSVVGLGCDFLFSRWLRGKSYTVITRRTLAAAMVFPIIPLLFGVHAWAYLAAMAVWGIYYELAMFSNYHFVDEEVQLSEQPLVWGFLTSIWSVAWFVAPLVATLLYDYFIQGPLVLALGFYVLSFGVFWLSQRGIKTQIAVSSAHTTTQVHFWQELQIWWILLKKLWPIYIFNFMTVLVMAGFWSVGALLAEELGESSRLGMLFFAAWTAPPLVFGLLTASITKRFRKKKTAFVCGIISGLLLVPLIFVTSLPLVVGLTFFSSIFYAIGYPGLDAAIQEYVAKLGSVGNDLVGLQSSAASFAYIFGPIVAGAVASIWGNQAALGVLGGLFALTGLVGVLVVRREIRLPHEALHAVLVADEV